jgi:hypothetical protein
MSGRPWCNWQHDSPPSYGSGIVVRWSLQKLYHISSLRCMIMVMRDIAKQRAWQLASMKRKRIEWLTANGPCRNCGSWERLEVDHVEPSEKVDHKVWTWSKVRREAELAKCQPLCHDCHRKKTNESRARPITHGTAGGYQRGCRCSICNKYQRDRMQQYHQTHPRSKKAVIAQLEERHVANVEVAGAGPADRSS